MAWYASVRLFNQKLELRSVSNWIFSQVGIANVLPFEMITTTSIIYIYIYTMMDFSNIRFWKFNRRRRAMRAILCRWSLPHFNRSLLGTSFQGAAALSQSEKGSVSAGTCQWSPDIDKALASGPFDQQIVFSQCTTCILSGHLCIKIITWVHYVHKISKIMYIRLHINWEREREM